MHQALPSPDMKEIHVDIDDVHVVGLQERFEEVLGGEGVYSTVFPDGRITKEGLIRCAVRHGTGRTVTLPHAEEPLAYGPDRQPIRIKQAHIPYSEVAPRSVGKNRGRRSKSFRTEKPLSPTPPSSASRGAPNSTPEVVVEKPRRITEGPAIGELLELVKDLNDEQKGEMEKLGFVFSQDTDVSFKGGSVFKGPTNGGMYLFFCNGGHFLRRYSTQLKEYFDSIAGEPSAQFLAAQTFIHGWVASKLGWVDDKQVAVLLGLLTDNIVKGLQSEGGIAENEKESLDGINAIFQNAHHQRIPIRGKKNEHSIPAFLHPLVVFEE